MSNKRNATRRKSSKRLRICLYARYSTEEQDESSIPDQFAYCKRELKALGIDLNTAIIEEHSDAETSGETVYRPGIDQVREGVFNSRWDIVVAEDVSRWFRNLSACCELVETAYDNGMRIIAFNDDVDSDEEGWDDRFYEAARHHAKTNRYTSFRIKRKLEALWEKDAAIGLLRPGYKRIRPKQEYVEHGRRRQKNPKFDEIDKKWKKVVHKAFERIAAAEEPWVVARWLSKKNLPKCSNAKSKEWTDQAVIALIRRAIYRGHDTYRDKVSLRKIRTGKKTPRWNDPEFVLTREMPHLRIVPDWLWYAANAKIDDRKIKENTQRGDDHRLTGIPRDSRYPLSNLFACDICQQKMWADGRNEGGYRCSCARKPSTGLSLCWNKATARREVAHRAISRAVTDELLTLDGVLDTMVKHIQSLVHDNALQEQEETRLSKMASGLLRECDRLADAIADGETGDVPATLVRKLREREENLAEAEAELERLRQSAASPQEISTADIAQRIGQVAEQLLDLNRTSGALLGRLIDGKIRAVPHMQFGGEKDKVVLRAQFTFHPVGILPDRLLAALSGAELGDLASVLPKKEITVDLFEPSQAPKHAMDALKLKDNNPTLTLEKLGKRLGVSKRSAHLALQLGLKMRKARIDDPFVPLTKPPANPSRWRDGRRATTDAA